jgi:uncharacterized membrane protein YphA (DoxX/SURF4 family)
MSTLRQPHRPARTQSRAAWHTTPMASALTRFNQTGYPLLACRLVLGVVFVSLGWNKAADPVAFLKMLRQYQLTENALVLNSIAAALPWFEILCGILLIAGIRVRATSLLIFGMLAAFTAAVLLRALDIHNTQSIAFCAIRFDCGCGTGDVLICGKLAENSLLIALSVWLLMARSQKFSLLPDRPDRFEGAGELR